MHLSILRVLTLATLLVVTFAGQPAAKPAQATGTLACPGGPGDCKVYLPMVTRGCTASGINYAQGLAIQAEGDPNNQANPDIIPAYQHPDKNLDIRSYAERTTGFYKGLVDYGNGSSDPNGTPPQFATIFNPSRVNLTGAKYYQVYDWNWDSTVPYEPPWGTRGSLLTHRLITALGLPTTPNEVLRLPDTSYRINQGYAAMVIYADINSITLKFTRDDSMASGYGVHIENICTDPGLLSLYNSLDQGERYIDRGIGSQHYNLLYLAPGQQFGTALGSQIIVAIRDNGVFEDPRSCRGWWINYFQQIGCPLRTSVE